MSDTEAKSGSDEPKNEETEYNPAEEEIKPIDRSAIAADEAGAPPPARASAPARAAPYKWDGVLDPRLQKLSRKQMKKYAKLTKDQLVMMGYGDIDFEDVLAGGPGTAPPAANKRKASELDADVKSVIAAQRRKAEEDPHAHRLRSEAQKLTAGFQDSNSTRQSIYMLYKDDKAKKRRIERREEMKLTAHIKKDKPAWLSLYARRGIMGVISAVSSVVNGTLEKIWQVKQWAEPHMWALHSTALVLTLCLTICGDIDKMKLLMYSGRLRDRLAEEYKDTAAAELDSRLIEMDTGKTGEVGVDEEF